MARGKREDRSSTGDGSGFGSGLAAALLARGLVVDKPVEEAEGAAPSATPNPPPTVSLARARVRHERKGRGGKTVTLVEGIAALDDAGRKALARALGKALGCGASVEDDAVVLQGDQRERATEWLEKNRRFTPS